MKINDLEEKIMSCWSTSDDVELLMRLQFDREERMSTDEIMNALTGIITFHNMRCTELFEMYEQCIKMFHDETSTKKET